MLLHAHVLRMSMHDLVQALRVFLWFSSQGNLGYPVQRGLLRC